MLAETLTQVGDTHRVGVAQVPERALLAHELPVDHHGEVHVQDAVVVDGQAQHDADQRELTLRFERGRIEPKQLCVFIVGEHACKKRFCKIQNIKD